MENSQESAVKKGQSSEQKIYTRKNGTGDTKKKRRLIIKGASRRSSRNILQGSKKNNKMKIKSLTDRLSELGSLTLDRSEKRLTKSTAGVLENKIQKMQTRTSRRMRVWKRITHKLTIWTVMVSR